MITMGDGKEGLERAILQVKHLPPLSPTACKLVQAIADEDIDLKALAGIIEQDPGLSARIIGLANSAYFSQPTPVFSIEEAIIRVLGLNLVKSLALGISVAHAFDTSQCPGFDLAGYWYEALAAGQLARSLVMVVPVDQRPDQSLMYLGGLLHNLGALLLVHVVPTSYTQVLRCVAVDPEHDVLAAERKTLGIDRFEAGVWLAAQWHLPPTLRLLMGPTEQMTYREDNLVELSLLNAAVEWMRGVRCGQSLGLSQSHWLARIEGLNLDRLVQIEEAFRQQLDELELIARQLA